MKKETLQISVFTNTGKLNGKNALRCKMKKRCNTWTNPDQAQAHHLLSALHTHFIPPSRAEQMDPSGNKLSSNKKKKDCIVLLFFCSLQKPTPVIHTDTFSAAVCCH